MKVHSLVLLRDDAFSSENQFICFSSVSTLSLLALTLRCQFGMASNCQLCYKKVKVGFFYSATYSGNAALYNRRKWQLIGKSQWCCSANCGHPLHALTYNWTRGMQLANTTPPLQSTAPGFHPISFHQMAPPV